MFISLLQLYSLPFVIADNKVFLDSSPLPIWPFEEEFPLASPVEDNELRNDDSPRTDYLRRIVDYIEDNKKKGRRTRDDNDDGDDDRDDDRDDHEDHEDHEDDRDDRDDRDDHEDREDDREEYYKRLRAMGGSRKWEPEVRQVHLAIAGDDSDKIRVQWKGTKRHKYRLHYAPSVIYTEGGGQCQFPFTYKKKDYYKCSTHYWDGTGKPWCMTTAGTWDYCKIPTSSDEISSDGIPWYWTAVEPDQSCQYFPRDPDVYVSAVTGKLAYNQPYVYRITGTNSSQIFHTGTFQGPKTINDSIRLSVFGDWGWGQYAHAAHTYTQLNRTKDLVDGFIHVGDIAYADDSFDRHAPSEFLSFTYEIIYNDFMDDLTQIADSKPYMVCPGNHESECHSPSCVITPSERITLSNFTAYNCRWQMPSKESGGELSMWYSYDMGPIHFVSLNTETDYHGAEEENKGDSHILPAGHFGKYKAEFLTWLRADLEKANATRHIRPWIIVYGHRPLYYKHTDCAERAVCDAFEALFAEFEVEFYMAGHIHTYQRYAKRNGDLPIHVYPGGAGCDERTDDEKFFWHGEDYQHSYFGFGIDTSTGILEVNRTHLAWYGINSYNQSQFDSLVIDKPEIEKRKKLKREEEDFQKKVKKLQKHFKEEMLVY